MKLALDEFKPIISVASAFTTKRDIVPILGHLVFQKNQISAYDGTSGAVLTTPWDFGPGFTLHADRLNKLLGAMVGFTEELELSEKNGKVRITGGGFAADFAVLKWSDFPFPKLPSVKAAQPVDADWGETIGRALFSVSRDETKPGLRGIWASGGLARSSDNYRITRIVCQTPVNIMLPEPLISRLGGAVSQVTRINTSENIVILYTDAGTFFTSQITTEFPDIDGIFEKSVGALKADKSLVAIETDDAAPLAMALRRILLFSEGDLLSRVIVTISKERGIRVETPERDLEKAGEDVKMPVKARQQEISFHVNGKMFLEVWEQCPRFYVAEDQNIPMYFIAKDKTFEHVLVKLME